VANAQALLSLLLTAGVFSVVANAIIAHRRNAAECKREMYGLPRLPPACDQELQPRDGRVAG
jgi:hypothetical protein